MKVLLISPPTDIPIAGTSSRVDLPKGIPLLPPLGLLYLSSELLNAGYEVEIADFNAIKYNRERLSGFLLDKDIVGISILSFNQEWAKCVISDIRGLNPTIPIIGGGPDLSLRPRLFDGTDVCVIGEAESRIVEIMDNILNGGNLSQCKGVIFRDKKTGEIKEGLEYQVDTDLDNIRFPVRHLLKNRYGLLRKKNIATIITSRGCPFNCKFCAHNAAVFWNYRERSAENVLDEIQEIYDNGYEILGIVDDNFTANRRRVLKIMDGIIKRRIKLAIALEGRVDGVDEEVYSVMKEAGVRVVYFGLESGNQDILDFYHKRTTVEQNQRAVELADKVGIVSVGTFIIGAPIEKEEHLQRTIDFAYSIPLDFVTFWVLEYAYGSPLWDEAYEKGLIKEDEFNITTGSERGLANFTTAELESTCLKAFRNFYLRPSWGARVLKKLLKTKEKYLIEIASNLISRLVLESCKKPVSFFKLCKEYFM